MFISKDIIIVLLALLGSRLAIAQPNPALWLREPALSPDGSEIVFTAQGRLFIAPHDGGNAVALTGAHYRSHSPVWSPDGRLIAFAANIMGNDDVYVMPVKGGDLRQLTVDSRDDRPLEFTTDSQHVIFRSGRPGLPQYDFYSRDYNYASLWSASVDGKQVSDYLPLPATQIQHYGDAYVMQMPGADQPWRKHQHSFAVSRIWLQQGNRLRQLTEDRVAASDPWWSPDGKSITWLSERSGTFNVWRHHLASGNNEQLTNYQQHPVRHLTASDQGSLAWSWNGEIYSLPVGERTPVKANFTLQAGTEVARQTLSAVLPDDATLNVQRNEAILVSHGDLFAVDLESGRSQLLTDTAEEESMPVWLPGGREILFLSEQNGYRAIYRLTSSAPLSAGGARTQTEIFRLPDEDIDLLALSRDGKKLALVANGQAIYLLSLESGKHRLLAGAEHNPMRHQISLAFSPDSRFLAFTFQPDTSQQEIAVIDTGQENAAWVNVSHNGYQDMSPEWSENGAILYWLSARFGMLRPDGEPGEPGLVGVFSSSRALADFRHKQDNNAPYTFQPGDPQKMAALRHPVSSSIIASRLVEDKLIYVTNDMAEQDKEGSSITAWSLDLRSGEVKELFQTPSAPLLASLDDKGEKLILIRENDISRIDLATKEEEHTTAFRLTRDRTWQQAMHASYQQISRLTPKEIYDANMNGVPWPDYVQNYQRFLPHITNPDDYAILLGELSGELNVSHTWGSAPPVENKNETASLGALFLERDNGLVLQAILPGGPLESESNAREGDRLIAINGVLVRTLPDLNRNLNHQAGNRQQLTFRREDDAFEEKVTAITQGQEAELQLYAWEQRRRDYVEQKSEGQLGYVYLPDMSENAYSHLLARALAVSADKKALIVDVRFNGGGYLANTLVEFLSGSGQNKGMAINWPQRGKGAPDSASRQWTKPSVVLANAQSYSEGSAFPRYYRALDIGPVIGEPIPGTGTVVYHHASPLIPGLSYGIPALALRAPDGQLYENNEQQPDVFVRYSPQDLLQGNDPQLDAAIEQALKLATQDAS